VAKKPFSFDYFEGRPSFSTGMMAFLPIFSLSKNRESGGTGEWVSPAEIARQVGMAPPGGPWR